MQKENTAGRQPGTKPGLMVSMPVPVIGVIEPGGKAAVAATRGGPVGVIGTAGTIASNAYAREIQNLAPTLRVEQRACPLLVPLVEEGWFDHKAAELIAQEYLAPLRDAHVDVLVLGCTHYPLLKPLLGKVMGPEVRLIDSAVGNGPGGRGDAGGAGVVGSGRRSGLSSIRGE